MGDSHRSPGVEDLIAFGRACGGQDGNRANCGRWSKCVTFGLSRPRKELAGAHQKETASGQVVRSHVPTIEVLFEPGDHRLSADFETVRRCSGPPSRQHPRSSSLRSWFMT